MISKILEFVQLQYPENEKLQKMVNIIKIILFISFLVGTFTLITTLISDEQKINQVSSYYEKWFNQLPDDYPLKQELYEEEPLFELQTELAFAAGRIFNSSEEILKYQLDDLDITEVGVLNKYLESKFDEYKPEYLLVDASDDNSLDNIKMIIGEKKSINLYRNADALSFDYIPMDQLFIDDKQVDFNKIISSGFVKAYIDNPDIATIEGNCITAISKGKTKLVMIYGTELLECNLSVK